MIKPISPVDCSAALRACQNLIRDFALWLCKPSTDEAHLTATHLEAALPSKEESQWLWAFLNKKHKEQLLLERALHLARLNGRQKLRLEGWVIATTRIGQYFKSPPITGAIPFTSPFMGDPNEKAHWKNLQDLMEAFYIKGLKDGLPYLPDGRPTINKKQLLTYETFRNDFLTAHKSDQHADARHVCVMCGGELRNISVDHWIPKSAYPLLSVCAENLVPICGECNGPQNKAAHPVHSEGSFQDWFHPYRRNPAGSLRLEFDDAKFAISLSSTRASDAQRVSNLNNLLNLEKRWTRELKAEYRKLYKSILTRQQRPGAVLSIKSINEQVQDWAAGLNATEPNHEVHQALVEALRDPRRIAAWKQELEKDLRDSQP